MLDAEYRLVDPADCRPSDEEPVEQREGLDLLRENLRTRGQVVPVLLAPDPEDPDKYRYIDGHGRGWCLARLGRTMKALVFPRPLTPAELIEFKFSNNLIRRTMSAEEIGLESARYIELTGCSQRDMAERLAVSDATISRCLARIRRIPPGCEAMARKLGPSFVAIILSLKDPEQRRRGFAFATTPNDDGRMPRRDELTRFVDEMKGKTLTKVIRSKRLRLLVDGREFFVELKPGDTPDSLIKAFRAAVAQLHENRNRSLETIATMLADPGSAA